MTGIDPIRTLFNYSDRANGQLIEASSGLTDDQLDRAFPMGRGSLRKTLLHIWAGEHVWLLRWKGQADTPWPDENVPTPVTVIARDLNQTSTDRDVFLDSLDESNLRQQMWYLDSVAGYFQATLTDMLLQGLVHSIHHRAQAVNMLRQLGIEPPEVDYMTSVRLTSHVRRIAVGSTAVKETRETGVRTGGVVLMCPRFVVAMISQPRPASPCCTCPLLCYPPRSGNLSRCDPWIA